MPGPLEILAIGPHDDDEDIGDDQGEERLLVQAGVGVDEQDVEREVVDQLAQPVGQPLSVVALPEDPRDLAGLHARGDEEEPASIHPADPLGDVQGDILDRPIVPKEVVERGVARLTGQTEEDVDAGRLNVGVDHADAEAPNSEEGRQVCGGIRLPGSTPKRVKADDRRHADPP